jgi:hypothetical protein
MIYLPRRGAWRGLAIGLAIGLVRVLAGRCS